MEGGELNAAQRHGRGIWHVIGSVPTLAEVRVLVLDQLHRCSLLFILLLNVIIVAAAFLCAALLVSREAHMVVSPRRCVDFIGSGNAGNNDTWFQSWKVDSNDTVCTRVEPNAGESANKDFFRNLFVTGKLHESFQMPLRLRRSLVRFNRGQRYLKGYITIDLEMPENKTMLEDAMIQLRLGARNGGGAQGQWQELGLTEVPLDLSGCQSRTVQLDDNSTEEQCVLNQRLFEVTSIASHFYLLNTRVQNMKIPPLSMELVLMFQTRLYTLVCLNIHVCFLFLLTLVLFVFVWRCYTTYHALHTAHRMLVCLAVFMMLWNIPVGYAALDYSMPWLPTVDAVRMDLFYYVFLAFCMVFVGERAFFETDLVRWPLVSYWRTQLPLAVCGLLLVLLDAIHLCCQRWDVFAARPDWLRYCLVALLVANAVYVLLLCVAAVRGWARLPARYRTLVLVTCVTAAAACVEHAERRESDNGWLWAWTDVRPTAGHLFYVGMLVWYNMAVLSLLILYTPTRLMAEMAELLQEDEQKVPLSGGDACPQSITRNGCDDPAEQAAPDGQP